MKIRIVYNSLGYVFGYCNGIKIEISHKQDFAWYAYISDKYIGKFPYTYKETNKQAFYNIVNQLFA